MSCARRLGAQCERDAHELRLCTKCVRLSAADREWLRTFACESLPETKSPPPPRRKSARARRHELRLVLSDSAARRAARLRRGGDERRLDRSCEGERDHEAGSAAPTRRERASAAAGRRRAAEAV